MNLPASLRAPDQRATNTTEMLDYLAATDEEDLSIALTEVQLRYFVDDRLDIISMDGRTSAEILEYFDPSTGVPDFERYFLDVRPDFVHANQWCAVGGWMASFFTSTISDNLVCLWEKQAQDMRVGDSFQWQGHRVTLVAPEIFRIHWNESS